MEVVVASHDELFLNAETVGLACGNDGEDAAVGIQIRIRHGQGILHRCVVGIPCSVGLGISAIPDNGEGVGLRVVVAVAVEHLESDGLALELVEQADIGLRDDDIVGCIVHLNDRSFHKQVHVYGSEASETGTADETSKSVETTIDVGVVA